MDNLSTTQSIRVSSIDTLAGIAGASAPSGPNEQLLQFLKQQKFEIKHIVDTL